MLVFIPVPLELFLVYVAAARLLQRALGSEAPGVNALLTQEFMHRRAKSIAEEYLELHGRPTLQTCRRALAKKRRLSPRARTRIRQRPVPLRSPGRSTGDPTLN